MINRIITCAESKEYQVSILTVETCLTPAPSLAITAYPSLMLAGKGGNGSFAVTWRIGQRDIFGYWPHPGYFFGIVGTISLHFALFGTFWYRFVSFTSWQRTLPKEFLKLTVSVASTPTPISSRIMLEHCKFSISNSNSISIADLDSLLKISLILTWSKAIFWAWSTLIIGHWETLALPATPTPPLSPWAGRWSK